LPELSYKGAMNTLQHLFRFVAAGAAFISCCDTAKTCADAKSCFAK